MTKYYVSPSGSDTNNGTSPATPWANHPWSNLAAGTALAARSAMAAGSTVYMAIGGIWYNTSLSNGTDTNITTTTLDSFFYGSGNSKPILSAGFNPATITWANTSGTIYSTTIANNPNMVVYDGVLLVNNSSTPTTPGFNEWGYSGTTLYVNVGENPSLGDIGIPSQTYCILTTAGNRVYNNMSFKLSRQTAGGGLYINAHNYILFNKLDISMFPNDNGIYISGGSNAVINSCSITGLTGRLTAQNGIRFTSTPTLPHALNNTINNIKTYGILNTSGTSAEITGNKIITCQGGIQSDASPKSIAQNTVKNAYHSSNSFGIRLNSSVASGIVIDNTIDGVDGTGSGIYLSGCSGVLVYKNIVRNCSKKLNGAPIPYPSGGCYAIGIDGAAASNEVKYNDISKSYVGVFHSTTSGSGGNIIRYNSLKDCHVNSITNSGDPNVNSIDISFNDIKHNVLVAESGGFVGHAIASQTNGKKTIMAYNNIHVYNSGTNCNGLYAHSHLEVLMDFNNITVTTNGNYGRLVDTDYNNIDNWKTAVQGDATIKNLAGTSNAGELNTTVTYQNKIFAVKDNCEKHGVVSTVIESTIGV